MEEAFGADTAVDGHADRAVAGKAAAVVDRTRTDLEHADGNPDHDRQSGGSQPRRPDVEIQAVFTRETRIRHQSPGWRIGTQLRWLRAKDEGVSHAAPRLDRLRRPESASAEGWRG